MEGECIMTATRSDFEKVTLNNTLRDCVALGLVFFGCFLFVVGWLAGLILLWTSRTWSRLQKICATLLWPLGFGLPVTYAVSAPSGSATCTVGGVQNGSGIAQCTWGGGIDLVHVSILVVLSVVPALCLIWLSLTVFRVARAKLTH